ncbi:MAG: site-2 protease family protein [Anaerolineae bacterium]|nr:site-2 protease family protein [Anaerolineae bacterium]
MTSAIPILWSVISVVPVLSLLVFVHEFGHFIVGKKAGVRVREFGFGYPLGADRPPAERPLCWKVAEDKAGTVYTFNLIPFGGFVNLGENDPDDPESLAHFPKRVRLAALLAGPAMNLVAAFVIFSIAALVGYPRAFLGVGIHDVAVGSPAEAAGIKAGDVIMRVGDMHLEDFAVDADTAIAMVSSVVEYVAPRAGQPVPVVIQRGVGADAEQIELVVTPRADENGDGKMGVSIGPELVGAERVKASFLEALQFGISEIAYTVQATVMIPIQVIRGLLPAASARSVGPFGIAKLTGDAVQQSLAAGWAYPILQLTGVLNVALAITNLLPLPALDGGRIAFILVEAIRGKPLPPEKEGLVHGIGLMILLLLLIAITIQDIFVPIPQGLNWSDYLY